MQSGREKLLNTVGLSLLALAALMLVALAWVAWGLVTHPLDQPLVQWVMAQLEAAPAALTGSVDGRHVEMAIAKPILVLAYLFVGAMVLGAFASIFRALTSGGVALLTLARQPKNNSGD
jgi:hypothetical protein